MTDPKPTKDHGFDVCMPCYEWWAAKHRRRGGQPVRCGSCGGPMRRITSERWELLIMGLARKAAGQ